MSSRVLVLGLGVAGRAALEALARREIDALAVDDAPGDEARACAVRLGVELVEAPRPGSWADLVGQVDEVVVAPGVPDRHPVFAAARDSSEPRMRRFQRTPSHEIFMGWRFAESRSRSSSTSGRRRRGLPRPRL